MSQGDYAQACGKFEESQRLDPGLGTLFHFADCEERLGKTATAWAAFLDVASEARAHGEADREAVARARAATLAPALARLTIDPGPSKDAPSFVVTRDGSPVSAAGWGVPIPVDPGTHAIAVHARNKRSWTLTVEAVGGTSKM